MRLVQLVMLEPKDPLGLKVLQGHQGHEERQDQTATMDNLAL